MAKKTVSAKKKAVKKKAPAKKRVVKKRAPAKKTKVKSAKKATKVKRKSNLKQNTYNLSQELTNVIGVNKATRPQIVKRLWVYIKANNLQDAKNKRMIVPDRKLAEVIGSRPVDMLKLAGYLNKHVRG